jgi:long-chain acyl-CoA synthetase
MSEPQTFPDLLRRNAERFGDRPAIRQKRRGIWRTISWRLWADEAAVLAAALAQRGVGPGSRVALLGDNRPRLFGALSAIHALGAVAMPLFQDAKAEEIEGPMLEAGVTHVFAENQEQVDKVLEILPRCPEIRCIVYDDDRSMGHYSQRQLVRYDALLKEGAKARGRAPSPPAPDDPAFLFYTSGATGPAKGVVLTHRALIDRAGAAARIEGLTPDDRTIAYLPPGWICQTLFSYVQPLVVGYSVFCPESSDTLLADMREAAPTVFLTTPRMLDTLVSQVSLRMEDAGGLGLKLFSRAVDLAQRIGRRRLDGESVPVGDRLNAGLYEVLVYGPLRDALGMSRVKVAYSAGDAIDPSVLSFFRALGVNLKQLYGSTETAFFVAMQRDGAVKPDTVGAPLDGVEIAFGADREILVRSPGLFLEYVGDPEGAAAARDAEGWFHTGDIGWMGPDGQLRILDRAADMGTLADGSPFAPRHVENKIKFSPYIREAVAIGDGRDRVCALIDINTQAAGRWADTHAIPFTGHADLASQPQIYELVAAFLAEVNAEIAAEPDHAGCQIHRFALLQEELNADDGVLTRTGKIRRAVVAERFAPLIEAIYAGRDAAPTAGGGEGGLGETGPTEIMIRDARVTAPVSSRRAA